MIVNSDLAVSIEVEAGPTLRQEAAVEDGTWVDPPGDA